MTFVFCIHACIHAYMHIHAHTQVLWDVIVVCYDPLRKNHLFVIPGKKLVDIVDSPCWQMHWRCSYGRDWPIPPSHPFIAVAFCWWYVCNDPQITREFDHDLYFCFGDCFLATQRIKKAIGHTKCCFYIMCPYIYTSIYLSISISLSIHLSKLYLVV